MERIVKTTLNNEPILSIDNENQTAIISRGEKNIKIRIDGKELAELEVTCENDELIVVAGSNRIKLSEYESTFCI